MQVLEIKGKQSELWDNFVNNNKTATFYHLYGWQKILSSTYGFKSHMLAAVNSKNDILGIMPLYLMRDIVGKRFLIATPFTNYSGLCTNDRKAKSCLLTHAKKLLKTYNAQYLELRNTQPQLSNAPKRDRFVTMLLDINHPASTIWSESLHSYVRNRIRKAKKSPIKLVECDDIAEFYEIYRVNMHRLGTPAFSLQFLKNQKKAFNDNIKVILVIHEGQPIAGMLCHFWGKTIYTPLVASLKPYNHFCPNNLMYWHLIETYAEKYHTLCMGRSTISAGTYHFKKRWGALAHPLHYEYILHKASRPPVVDAHQNHYNVPIKIWKMLPQFLVDLIGPRIVKYLPEL